MPLVRLSQIDSKIFESELLEDVVLKTFAPIRDVFSVTME